MNKKEATANIHAGHRQRVKEKVLRNGLDSFADHELLELLLFYSIPQSDTNELAHRLLSEFTSFEGILKADISQLKKVKGVGESTALLIYTAAEVYRRAEKLKLPKKVYYKTTEDFKALAQTHLSLLGKEKVVLFCFDANGKLKKTSELSTGSSSSAFVDVKKAVECMLDSCAVKAVIAHNHPDSSANPSAADIDVTRSVCVMFRKLDFVLMDHIIVGEDGDCYSMYEESGFSGMFY